MPQRFATEARPLTAPRPLALNSGTKVSRQQALNFEDGLDAVANPASSRVDVGIADEGVTSRKLAPTVIEQRCTANTTINSGTDTDITGATITLTPAIASVALVIGTFDIDVATTGDVFIGVLDVDGVNEGAQAVVRAAAANDRHTLTQHWLLTLTAAAHTLKLQSSRGAGSTGSATVNSTHTKLTVILLGDNNATVDTSS